MVELVSDCCMQKYLDVTIRDEEIRHLCLWCGNYCSLYREELTREEIDEILYRLEYFLPQAEKRIRPLMKKLLRIRSWFCD